MTDTAAETPEIIEIAPHREQNPLEVLDAVRQALKDRLKNVYGLEIDAKARVEAANADLKCFRAEKEALEGALKRMDPGYRRRKPK